MGISPTISGFCIVGPMMHCLPVVIRSLMRPGSTLTLFPAVGRVVIPLELENALRAVLEAMSGAVTAA